VIDDKSDARLLREFRKGDMDAFAVFVKRHQDVIYRLALRNLGDPETAREAAQEVFVRAWQKLGRWQFGHGKPELYVANFRTINGQSVHRGISRFESSNGINFNPVSHHVVLPTENRWSRWHVRFPSVVEHSGTLYMWFAADDFEEGVTDPRTAVTGLGLATLPSR